MSAGIAALVARGARSSSVRQFVTPTFDEIVELFKPNVISYWKFTGDTGATVVDVEGQENATITGSPELNVPTIVRFDSVGDGALTDGTCIAWPGQAGHFAQAAHDAAHKTVAGTVVVCFQRDSAAEKSQLIMADPAPAVAGGMGMGVNINGGIDAYINGAGGTPVPLIGGAGDVQLDRAYVLIFKWGTGGMSLALWNDSGSQVRRLTSASTIGLSGTSPIRFGATHTDTSHHDGPYGRVIWIDRRITDAEEVILAQAFTIARSASSYRDLELNMGPLSLWGLGENSGAQLLDSVGIPPRNGTYSGTILHNTPDLPDNSTDGAINFAGTGSGTVPHEAAFELAEYTLSFWFRTNIIGAEGAPTVPLVIKSSGSAIPGHMSCYLASNNNDVLRLRVRGATSIVDINTRDDAIHVGVTYHVCIRGGATGVDLHLDGRFIGKQTSHTIGLTGNTQVWQIAWGIDFGSTLGDCVIDEICLFPRVITVPEIAALAQRTSPPVAVADAATVLENTTEAIDIVGNDSYVGIPTIEIINQPGGGDSVAVIAVANTLPFVEYTAGAIGPGGAGRLFNYRIADVNGTSNTITVPVTVQDSGFVADPLANCYVIAAETANVNNMGALEAAINAAAPGAQITIDAGTYAGGNLQLDPQGTTANPIVVRPVGGRGSVIINNAIWTLANTSARLVITNLHFNNAEINVNGAHHRIARCQFRDLNHYAIRLLTATDTRISHCDFSEYRPTSITDHGCIQFDCQSLNNNALQRALVDYCHIHDIDQRVSKDPANILQIGSSCGSWNNKCGIVIDHCLMNNIKRAGGNEFIVNKTSEVTYRYCTMTDMAGGPIPGGGTYANQWLQQRQGAGIEVRSCWMGISLLIFDDVNVPEPVRDALIIGNHFTSGFDIHCKAGNDRPGQGGVVANIPGPYHHCENVRFIGNELTSGNIIVGNISVPPAEPAGTPDHYQARNNNIVLSGPRANTRSAGAPVFTTQFEVNTTTTDDTAADNDGNSPPVFTPAEQLFPADVGVGAPDPLCPTGPQS